MPLPVQHVRSGLLLINAAMLKHSREVLAQWEAEEGGPDAEEAVLAAAEQVGGHVST
jgi:hypothetical protein